MGTPYRMFSRAISPFTPNLSAMERILSGLNVPSVSMYAAYKVFACTTIRIDKMAHLPGCTTHVGRELTHNAHGMRQLCFTRPEFSVHCERHW